MREWETRTLTQPYRDCLASLQHLTLFAETQQLTAKVVSAVPTSDEGLIITGSYDQRTQARSFYTAAELDEIRRWDERRRNMEEAFAGSLDYYRHSSQREKDEQALSHSRQIREYDTRREVELRDTNKAATERAVRYKQVSVRVTIPAELAKSVDAKKLLTKKSIERGVKLLIQVTGVELQAPFPEAGIPASVSAVIGDVVDIEKSVQIEQDPSTP